MSRRVSRTRLDQLEELGEDQVFAMYVELGTVRKIVEQLFVPAGGEGIDWGRRDFYRWLRLTPERWQRWTEAQQDRGHVEADMVLEEAEKVTPENASAARVKINSHQWRAERLNRATYGLHAQIDVGGDIGLAWLEALRAMASKEASDPPRPSSEG